MPDAANPLRWRDPSIAHLCEVLSGAIARMAAQTKTDRYIFLGTTVFLLFVTLGVACFLVVTSSENKSVMALVGAIVSGSGGGLAAALNLKIMKIWDGYLELYKETAGTIENITLEDGFEFVHTIINLMLSLARIERRLFLAANAIYVLVLCFVIVVLIRNQLPFEIHAPSSATSSATTFILIAFGTSAAGAGGLLLTTGRMLAVWQSYQSALQGVITKQKAVMANAK